MRVWIYLPDGLGTMLGKKISLSIAAHATQPVIALRDTKMI
jgi:hypothetical protein